MPKLGSVYDPPADLVLGTRVTARLPEADQRRQRTEALEILSRLRTRPGVIRSPADVRPAPPPVAS